MCNANGKCHINDFFVTIAFGLCYFTHFIMLSHSLAAEMFQSNFFT